MTTRRQLLFDLASLSTSSLLVKQCRPAEIISEPHSLSEESARGYRKLLSAHESVWPGLIILPASCRLSLESAKKFRQRVIKGSRLILESGVAYSAALESTRQRRILAEVFGIHVGEAVPMSTSEASYVTYRCPRRIMVRTFGAITPVHCASSESITEFEGIPVAMARQTGDGTVVFLGSILGIGLLAHEREAREMGNALVQAGNSSIFGNPCC